jgi:hypothetical protein
VNGVGYVLTIVGWCLVFVLLPLGYRRVADWIERQWRR